ncbi:MAG TPA: GNAT family N-acetyltransferase [Kofleriaceae bacterium]|nr:GNAT family N-acetyltransferase [Kofleriaceae bacterium]
MIATARLRLRPLTVADAPKLFAMSQAAGMRRWIPDQVYRDEAHAAEVVASLADFAAQAFDPRARPFVLGIEHDRELVGHVGLSPCRGSVEVGYAIEDAHQGRGLASEAVRAMVEWAQLPEVLGIVAADNVASARVLEKAGFARIGDGPYRRTT